MSDGVVILCGRFGVISFLLKIGKDHSYRGYQFSANESLATTCSVLPLFSTVCSCSTTTLGPCRSHRGSRCAVPAHSTPNTCACANQYRRYPSPSITSHLSYLLLSFEIPSPSRAFS